MGILEDLEGLIGSEEQKPVTPPRPLSILEKWQAMIGYTGEEKKDEEKIVQRIYRDVDTGRVDHRGEPIYREVVVGTLKEDGTPPPIRNDQVAHAVMKGAAASFLGGVLYPISSILPEKWMNGLDDASKEGQSALRNYLATGEDRVPEGLADVLSHGPNVVGTGAGMFIPGAGIIKGTNAMFKVGAQVGKMANNIAAGSAAGVSFSALARYEDGQSRLEGMLRDAVLGGLAEIPAYPIIRALTREELGKDLAKVVTEVAEAKGITQQAAESEVIATRVGMPDIETARVVERATRDPQLEHTPVAAQARKFIEAWSKATPGEWKVDAALPRDYGIALELEINGERMPYRIQAIRMYESLHRLVIEL